MKGMTAMQRNLLKLWRLNARPASEKDNFKMPLWEMAQYTITMLKKVVYDEGWEVISILVLKRRIKEKAQKIPLPTILCLFNTVKERLAVCA